MNPVDKESGSQSGQPTDVQILRSLQPGERRFEQFQALVLAGFEVSQLLSIGALSKRQVDNWEREIDVKRLPEHLDDLRALVGNLTERRMATFEQIVAWFNRPNDHLDCKPPIDQIDRFEDVLSAADRTLRI